MNKPVFSFAVLLSCLASSSFASPAQTAAAPAPPVFAPASDLAYKNESLIFEKLSTIATFHTDGTGEKLITVSVRIRTEDAVRNNGTVSIAYQAENERVEMLYLRVRKPDGSIVETPVGDAQDLPMPVTRAAPMYSDSRDKEWPVRSLAAGDRLEYQVRIPLFKPMAPGQFWGQFQFETNTVVLEQELELHVPRDRHVQVLSPEDKFERTEAAGEVVYRWRTTHLEPTVPADSTAPTKPKKPANLSSLLPSVRWTSFAGWAEVGDWYRGLQDPRAVVTPEIRAKADELTQSATTDDEKLHRLYTYVAAHIRYVGVDFGAGRYQPHAAAEVLANQYGDCKDKHTLLQALLAAKGFHASPVLIGAGIHFDTELPSPQSFNHLITQVTAPGPSQDRRPSIWLDSTAEVAPFSMLSAPIRDKEALVIPVDGTPATIQKTPALAPFHTFERYEATGTLDSRGALKADVSFTVRGDTELVLRSVLRQVPQSAYPDFATGYATGIGLPGKASALKVDALERFDEPLHIAMHDEVVAPDAAPETDHRTLARLLPAKLFQAQTYDEQPLEPIPLGNPRTVSARSTISLPDALTATLPDEVHLRSSFATYDSHCSLAGSSVVCVASAEMKQPKLPADRWEEYNTFVSEMMADQLGELPLIARGSSPASAPAAATHAAARIDDTAAAALVRDAYDAIGQHDLDKAAEELAKAETLNPEQARLWSTYGFLAFQRTQYDKAVDDDRKELALYPDAFGVYASMAQTQILLKQRPEAILTLQAAHKSKPDDLSTIRFLASLLTAEKRYPEALTLLQADAFKNPSNKQVILQLGMTQLAAGRTDEAVATLHTAIEDATDPLVLNDAAYQLASHKADLPLAEASARKALSLLDAETQKFSLADVTQQELGRVSLLSATWDTLGWIDFTEDKPAEAEPLIAAAWATSQHAEVGYHLGCVYEKVGKQKEALRAFHQARAAMSPGQTFVGSDDLAGRIAALEKAATSGAIAPNSNAAGEERVYTLPLLTKKQAAGDYYLLLSPGKVEGASWIEGAPELKAMEGKVANALQPALVGANKPLLFPYGSGAKQVRRGVLSCSMLLRNCMLVLMLPQDARVQPKPVQAQSVSEHASVSR